MIKAACELLQQGKTKVERYTLYDEQVPLSSLAFFQRLSNFLEFRLWFSDLLKSSSFNKVAFETPCIGPANLNEPFQFVLVPNPALATLTPDPYTFEAYFIDDSSVASFTNLSLDAQLIAPKPSKVPLDYSHLMAFIENSPEDQLSQFWERVGHEVLKRISQKPQWISTAGLGVYWLHLRVSDVPKYYRYEPFIKE